MPMIFDAASALLRTARNRTTTPRADSSSSSSSSWFSSSSGELRPAIDADLRGLTTAVAGKLVYYVERHPGTRPLVLLHGIHAAASSYEMRPFFDAFRHERTVYALDLPGFGRSARDARAYDHDTFRGAIQRFLIDVADPGGRGPLSGVDVIASSLSSEHAAAVAVDDPSLVRSLILVSPTGLATKPHSSRLPLAVASAFERIVRTPVLSKALYRSLVSRPALTHFLRKSFAGDVDEGLLAYCRETTRVRGAERAPLAFLAGAPFRPHIFEEAYARLTQPTLILYDRDAYTSFERLGDLVKQNVHVKTSRVAPSRGLPQFEVWGSVENAIRQFWARNVA